MKKIFYILIGLIITGLLFPARVSMAAWSYTQDFNALTTANLNNQDNWKDAAGGGTWSVVTTDPYEGAKHVRDATGGSRYQRNVDPITDSGTLYYATQTSNATNGLRFRLFGDTDAAPFTTSILACTINFTGGNIILDGASDETMVIGYTTNLYYVVELEFSVTGQTCRARVHNGTSWTDYTSNVSWVQSGTNIDGIEIYAGDATIDLDDITPTNPISDVTDSCTYGGTGNWDVQYSDNCYVAADVYVNGEFNLIASSTGSFGANANISATRYNFGNSHVLKIDCKSMNCFSAHY